MKENDAVNFKSLVNTLQRLHKKEAEPGVEFIRTGQTGDHRNKMSPEMMSKFDEWNRKMKQELGIPNNFPH